MTDPTAEFFEEVGRRGHHHVLEGVTRTVRFDLTHRGQIESWLVRIENGDVQVTREAGDADSVVRTDRAVFDGIASGKINGMAALLRGAITAEGDLEMIVQLKRLIPGPSDSHQRPQPAGVGR